MNTLKRLLLPILLALTAALGGISAPASTDTQEAVFGTSESGAQWVNIDTFQGYQTKYDQEKISDGAAANGQNTTPNETDRISIRDLGYTLFPESATYSTTNTKVGTLHTFRKRDAENIIIRAVSSTLEWYETSSTRWEVLKSGYSSDDFGFADNNVNTDQVSYTYFGNGVQPFSRWTGEHSILTSALVGAEVTINVASTDGFPTTGIITYCGTEQAYSAKTATTFTVVSAVACASGRGVAEAVREFATSSFPRGNIYLFADNRLWISGVSSSLQVVYFSSYGSSTNFGSLSSLVSDSTDASAGLFNLAEGGGPVTAMVMDEESIYVFKRSIIYRATLTDTTYSVTPLKAFDQKSQTTGAVNKRSTFTSSNGVLYITPDNQIMLLDRVEQVDYPQITAISDIIKPTVDDLFFDDATGIVFGDKVYLGCKTTAEGTSNDVVLVYNTHTKIWDTPIVGWNVGDWAIYQDETADLEELHFGDGITANTYVVTSIPQDYIYDTTASWRSKQYTFGLQHALKYVENVYVEGYISPSTDLNISLLLDEDGFTQRYSTTLSGSDSEYIYDSSLYNAFGLTPFGTRRFGAQEDLSGKKKFRIYLGKDFRQAPFYNAQIEFASSGENQQWEVTGYGFLIRQAPVPELRKLFKSFN